ncbi:MAG: CNNM domain-containing protein, partial [Gemmatimonadota bacterium]
MFELGLVVALGLAGSFLCSVMEAVLLSTSHSFVAVLQDRGDRAGRLLAKMQHDIDEPIAAILTLNTIAHTVGAAVGGALALEVFGNEWVATFSAALTLAILMFSEILPKTLGATFWQQLARPVAYTLRTLIFAMKPILVPLALFNRLITPRRKREATVSRAELEVLAAIGRREGTIREEEWRVVSNAMNLNRIRVRDVMTPRTRMVGVSADATLADVRRVMLQTGYFRLPVYGDSVDDVVGILIARDVWRAEEAVGGAVDRDREDGPGRGTIAGILHEPYFVPETKPA